MRLFSSDAEVCGHRRHLSAADLLHVSAAGHHQWHSGMCRHRRSEVTTVNSFVNMGVRVIAAVILVFVFSLQIEALPISYLVGWIGMLIAEAAAAGQKLP